MATETAQSITGSSRSFDRQVNQDIVQHGCALSLLLTPMQLSFYYIAAIEMWFDLSHHGCGQQDAMNTGR
ncbi:MAG: hypothetical protein MZV49_01970 [Rhodopseudomonas palustris]|nr:hypothetical protein [Rhodopseudomonas palustris]